MNEREVFKRVTNSRADFLHEFLDVLEKNQVPFCVIGGLAVNAYAEPVISLETHPHLLPLLPGPLGERVKADLGMVDAGNG